VRERALREKGQQLQAVLDMSQAGIFMTNASKWTILYANNRMAELFRCTLADLDGAALMDFIHPDEIERARLNMHMMVTGEIVQIKEECRLIRSDGSEFWGKFVAQSLVNENGSLQGVMVSITDNTELRETEQTLSIIENNYWEIFNATNDAVFVNDAYTGAIIEANKSVEKMYGYSREEIFFMNVNDFSFGEPPYTLDDAINWIRKASEEGPQSYEWLGRKKSGELFWAEVSLTASHIGGEGRVLSVIRDISDRKKIENKLQYLSSHDSLTGLYNRSFFESKFDCVKKENSYPISVIVADLDGLKMVNDTCGHEAGDVLIKSAAKILDSVFRAEYIVARVGGDEFVILLPESDEQKTSALLERIREAERRINSENRLARVRLSLGNATAHHAIEMQNLLNRADKRMYEDKTTHKLSGNVLSSYSSPIS
jgi:diguanylate cyclase (GGDEF)-like protein/PAS domain S-box-containing protein